MPDSVTLLHISDMQFGRNHRFGRLGLPGTDAKFDTLFSRLTDDLKLLRDGKYQLKPDVLVVSGDLAEWGLKTEFDDARQFVEKLTEYLKLPDRSRVVIVAGNHDINRKYCLAYFADCDADEELPEPPFWNKWKPFVETFECFYTDVPEISFTPEQPWTLFEMQTLKIVVAGLNSTMPELHIAAEKADGSPDADFVAWKTKLAPKCDLSLFGHFGRLGETQLRWFKERLQEYERQGWLRIGVVHHNVIRGAVSDEEHLVDRDLLERELGGSLNLLLHGHTHRSRLEFLRANVPIFSTGSAALVSTARPDEVPNQYQILRLSAERVERWTRCYDADHRWVGDVSTSPQGDRWHTSYDITFASVSTTFPNSEPTSETSTPPAIEVKSVDHPVSTGFSGRAATASTLPGYASDFYTEPTPGLLDEIEGSLRENGLTFLYGPPGSGKSLTASVVANKSTCAYRFWVNAESELALIDTLAAAQRKLLNLKPDNKDDVKSFARGFLEALPTLSDWLLIYDNAADLKLLEEWLPKTAGKRPILLTSQNDPGIAFAGRQIARHELDELEEGAAQLFFLRRAGILDPSQTLAAARPDDLPALVTLFSDLGRLPLALEAAAHVCSKGVSIGDYHTELTRTQQPKLWGDEVTTATRHPGLHRSLTVLFERIKDQSPDAFEILLDAAWLEPDRIPTWLLPSDATRPLLTLASDRLLVPVDSSRSDASGNNLRRMHREHQFHLRGMLDAAQRRERLENLIYRLQLPDDLNFELWRTDRATGRRFEGALPAIVRLAGWGNRQQLPSEFHARLQHAQAVLQFDSGNYPAAEQRVREALGMLQPADTVLFAALQEQLAVVLCVDYRMKDALQLLDDSLDRLSRLQQTKHPSYAGTLRSKANALLQQSEKREDIDWALALFDEALRIILAAKGKNHPSYGNTLTSKAYALLQRGAIGDIDTALALLDEDLSIKEASQWKSHPSYGSSLRAKADALLQCGAKGDIDAALSLIAEAMNISEASQGKSHPAYAGYLHTKAAALLRRGAKGDIDAALALFDEAAQIKEASQGRGHPNYAVSLHEKARALIGRGINDDLQEAIKIIDEVLRIYESTVGKTHREYGVSLAVKASAHVRRNHGADLRRALESINEAVRIIAATRGDRHIDTANMLMQRGDAKARQGKRDRAKEGLVDIDEAIRIVDELFPDGHPILGGFLNTRASLRRALGQPKGAEADAKRAVEVQAKFGRQLENS